MTLRAGDAFLAPWPGSHGVCHLHFVISDPTQDDTRILLVPLMTWDAYKEQTCIVEPGEHKFVRHTSYIDYGCAVTTSAVFLKQRVGDGTIKPHAPASVALLAKVREGAERSDFLALEYRDILERQGLVEPLA